MRTAAAYALVIAALAGLVWALALGIQEPADFTFSNQSEIKTVDPALVTGQPEQRIVSALFEGLTTWDPQDLWPRPGVAERWTISDDKLTCTFYLRGNALWSDGTPVTADDFVWSYRRALHPATSSEYAYELWYIVGAEQYTSGKVNVGDAVEVELNDKPPGARPFASGIMLRGRLTAIEKPAGSETPVYVVQINGRQRRFQKGALQGGTEDYRWLLYDFQAVGLEAVNSRVLQIRLKHPVPYFLNLMGFFPMSPVNRKCVEAYGYPAWTKPEHIVSNGPFLLESRRIRDRIRLVKNPRYWDRDHVELNVVDAIATDSTITALNLYLTGEVDWVPVVPEEIIPDLRRQHRTDFRPAPYLANEYYLVNTRKPPLDDPRVRLALGLAMDKQEIVERIVLAGQTSARSMVPPEIRRYDDYRPAECGAHNVERARKLLAEAGYPGGRGMPRIEILYNTNETHQAIAELVQSQWKRNLGVNVRLANQDWARYLNSRRVGDYLLARAGWIGDYVDPVTFLAQFASDNPMNQTGWKNPKYDHMLELARQEKDDAKRLQYLHRAEQILMDQMPVIPIFFNVTREIVRPYVHGYYRNILDTHPLKDIRVDQREKARLLQSEGLR
jgi:oligopeptide transport system substrate-binding protein